MKPNNKHIHFFDLDGTLWKTDSKFWIIDKLDSSKPLFRISQYDMSLINSGLYKKDDIKILYNGKTLYISEKLFNKIQRLKKIPKERIGISQIEFIDKNYIENTKFDFLYNNIKHLKNTDGLICFLTARSNREYESSLLNKLRLYIKETINKDIYKIYFNDKNETNPTEIAKFKTTILLEHLIGMKIFNNSFKPLKQDWFSNVHFYDDLNLNIEYSNKIQELLNIVMKNTEKELYDLVTYKISNNDLFLYTYLITNNDLNLFIKNVIKLKEHTIYPITKFENFNSWNG